MNLLEMNTENNPVEAGFGYSSEEYTFSSARDYSGEKGLVDIILTQIIRKMKSGECLSNGLI